MLTLVPKSEYDTMPPRIQRLCTPYTEGVPANGLMLALSGLTHRLSCWLMSAAWKLQRASDTLEGRSAAWMYSEPPRIYEPARDPEGTLGLQEAA